MARAAERFTADELLGELRRRERQRNAPPATAGPKARGLKARPQPANRGIVARFHDLSKLSSGELAKLLRARQRAIYGTDDRQDTKDVKDRRALALADASVALVKAPDLTAVAAGGYRLWTVPFKDDYQLCDREPFAQQPLGCFCSGVLVAPDVIATAGHCLETGTKADLRRMRVVFGFRMLDKSRARTEFPETDVYQPVEIVGHVHTQSGADWALLRLDRKVVGRRPVDVRTSGKIGDTERVFVIGHPCGLPQKVAGKARVRDNTPSTHFAATLDTYGGNSGSPVFSEKTYRLEGLLVRGQTDFVSAGGCYVSMVFPTSGAGGEDVMRAPEWASRLRKGTAKRPLRPAGSAKSRRKGSSDSGLTRSSNKGRGA